MGVGGCARTGRRIAGEWDWARQCYIDGVAVDIAAGDDSGSPYSALAAERDVYSIERN